MQYLFDLVIADYT